MAENKTHGGAREGAGRPAGKPTKVLTFRVPAKGAAALKKKIQALIEQETKKKAPV